MKNIDAIMTQFINKQNAMEQSMFMDIFRQIENREPLPSDRQRFTKHYSSRDPLNYELAFDDTIIGSVVFGRDGNEFSIEFIPR